MERLTMRTPSGASLKMADEYENEAAARKDLMQRYLVAVDRLAVYEDAGEAGRLVVLPDNTDCDTCPLCGDYGDCPVTGYPPEPDKCRDTIRKEAEAALGGDEG